MKFHTLCMVLLMISRHAIGQDTVTDLPIIGKVCPNYSIHNVTRFPKQEVSIDDFRGRYLILDFWSRSCLTCIKSFPGLNDLQKEFKEDIQFMVIASNDKKWGTGIQEFFEKIALTYHLEIPSAYDSVLFQQLQIKAVPYVIILDREGIVKAITYSENITRSNLKKLLSDNTFPFSMIASVMENPNWNNRDDPTASLPMHEREKEELYQSVFTPWYPGDPISIVTKIDRSDHAGRYNTSGISLERLFKIAYLGETDWKFGDSLYGRFWATPILKTEDSILFRPDVHPGGGRYNYSLLVPKSRSAKDDMKWAMQCDLKKYFNKEVSIEVKSMPCWQLTLLNKSTKKLKTKGEKAYIELDVTGVSMTNQPVNELLKAIWVYHTEQPPFIDATGITGSIDIKLNAMMTDLNEVNEKLNQSGLALVKSSREMLILVVR